MSDENGSADGVDPTPTDEVGKSLDAAEEVEGFLGTPWSRRTFLKAAALGTAAAAVFQKGPGWRSWGPAAAYADDLSGLNCTANDVRIAGPGIILNEPCTCTPGGTFPADVQFHVINNTGTTRYCVTAHLCAGVDANGNVIVPAKDIVIGDIPANFDGLKTVTIQDYPCGTGLVCFGVAGSQADGGFAKGEACPATKCCTTITWNVKASDPCPDTTRQISSKCRHQQVCIQGFGITATCADASCGSRSLTNGCCSVDCGAALHVKIVASGQTGATCNTPLTISVKRPGGSFQNVTLDSSGCYNDSSPIQGTYTFRATDCHNCFRETTLAVCVAAIATPTLSKTDPSCAGGNGTVTVTNADSSLQYTFKEGSTVLQGPGSSSSYTGSFTAGPHTITVIASNGTQACDKSANITVTAPTAVTVALGAATGGCDGVMTFTAVPSGGSGSYTFEWRVNGTVQSATGSTLSYGPNLDNLCHTVSVKATDTNGCASGVASRKISQCVTSTQDTGACA